jgi:hypothetical protein
LGLLSPPPQGGVAAHGPSSSTFGGKMEWLLVFAVRFIWSWLATLETVYISGRHIGLATLFSALNSTFGYLAVLYIALREDVWLVIPYAAGDTIATHIALKRRK